MWNRGPPPLIYTSEAVASRLAADCKPLLHDLPKAAQPGLLLQTARKAYGLVYAGDDRVEALAINAAADVLSIIRHTRRNNPALAAALGIPLAEYREAVRIGVKERMGGDTLKDLKAHDAFMREIGAAIERYPPGPQLLCAAAAALADRGMPNQLWVKKFQRDGANRHTAEFLANLQEKLVCELDEPQRTAFLRACVRRAHEGRCMMLLFRECFDGTPADRE